jgi:hypothetical protein
MAVRRRRAKCLVNTCDRDATHCGLCHKHYLAARRVMSKGEATEQELIEVNLWRPPHTTPQGDFRQQLAKSLAERRTPRCESRSA